MHLAKQMWLVTITLSQRPIWAHFFQAKLATVPGFRAGTRYGALYNTIADIEACTKPWLLEIKVVLADRSAAVRSRLHAGARKI